ncbi:2'-5' RNA ligase family protein [Pedobacter sp. Leaf250]|uniref:2'-5' RNA ligase family protein n=1 Tax=Pedobacter sp. Leaf250 TaxID=2876559 RepID=UPI001E496CDC|nr:2'-5' RNA ligase family protein [Pedobacter sp. Leaf250]
MQVYILTLRIDQEAQAFFDQQRKTYFPIERNLLNAHLTLFHHLINYKDLEKVLSSLKVEPFWLIVSALKQLGRGVAYKIDSEELNDIRLKLAKCFWDNLTAQDKQGYRPHITIQNKVEPEVSKILYATLQSDFTPFAIQGLGLDLWEYLGGPWKHVSYFPFQAANRL